MWRGLMLNRAVQHFLEDVGWGDLDYLLIDMPPGTGDVQMGLARLLPRAEMIVVTTPVAHRAEGGGAGGGHGPQELPAHRRRDREHVGATSTTPAASTGCSAPAAATAWPPRPASRCSGRIPIEAAVADGGDHGHPIALGEGPAADAFRAIARTLIDEVVPPADLAGCSARMLGAMAAALDAAEAPAAT